MPITGTNGDDFLVAGDAQLPGITSFDEIYGLRGNDTLIGGPGNNLLDGGEGTDTVHFSMGWGDGVEASLITGQAFRPDGSRIDTLVSIENLRANGINSKLVGDDNNNFLSGGFGVNRLYGNGGNDHLSDFANSPDPKAGTILDGGDGLDLLAIARSSFAGVVFQPNTEISLADGTVIRNFEKYDVGTGNGDDVVTFRHISHAGAQLWNNINASNGNDTAVVDLSNYTAAQVLIMDNRVSTSLPIQTYSEINLNADWRTETRVIQFWGVENYRITGGQGNDRLTGYTGVDIFTGGAGNDILDGGANIDTAAFSGNRAAYTITQGSPGNFTIAGPDGSDTLTNFEYAQFADQTVRLLRGDGIAVDFSAAPASYMAGVRDFDGNNMTGRETFAKDAANNLVTSGVWDGVSGWTLAGTADLDGGGDPSRILFNSQIGRWASVAVQSDGQVYFGNHGWAGDTRIVGIYVDPLVQSGAVVAGSATDSQRRFQNDLFIGNLKSVLHAADYDKDGGQEVYFSLSDGTAYLHAYMHADGNIRYANYQSKQQVQDYLAANNYTGSLTWLAAAPPEALAEVSLSSSGFADFPTNSTSLLASPSF